MTTPKTHVKVTKEDSYTFTAYMDNESTIILEDVGSDVIVEFVTLFTKAQTEPGVHPAMLVVNNKSDEQVGVMTGHLVSYSVRVG